MKLLQSYLRGVSIMLLLAFIGAATLVNGQCVSSPTGCCVDYNFSFNYSLGVITSNQSPVVFNFPFPSLLLKGSKCEVNLTGVSWEFGDGTSGTGLDQAHTYTLTGNCAIETFLVEVCVELVPTGSNTYQTISPQYCSFSQYVVIQNPNFTNAYEITTTPTGNCSEYTLSYTPESSLASPEWNFGDGDFEHTGQETVTHTFPANGYYTITLGNAGLENCLIAYKVLEVNDLPSVDFTYDVGTEAAACDNVVNFTISNYDPLNYSYIWSFGTFTQIASSSTTTFEFPSSGTAIVKLEIIDAEQCAQTTTKNLVVGTIPATFTTQDVCTGTQLQVSNVITGGDSYNWTLTGPVSPTFPTGYASFSGLIPFHTFNAPGTYTLTLTVLSQGGACPETLAQEIEVQEIPDPTFEIIPGNCGLVDILFANSPTFTSYQINYGDGPLITTTATALTPANASHTYTANGSYQIAVTLFNGACEKTLTQTLSITDLPSVYLNAPSLYLCENSSLTLSSIVNVTGDGQIDYEWIETSGQNSPILVLGTDAQLLINAGGTYQLTVTYNSTCIAKASVTITDLIEPTAELISATPTTCFGEPDGAASIKISGELYRLDCLVDGVLLDAANTSENTVDDKFTYHLTGLAVGTYYITIAHNLDPTCYTTLPVTILGNGPVIIVDAVTPSTCNGAYGKIETTISDDSAINWYAVANYPNIILASGTEMIETLAPGDYVVEATLNGCTIVKTINVPSNTFTFELVTSLLEVCEPEGSIAIEVDELTYSGISYQWQKPDGAGGWETAANTGPSNLESIVDGPGDYQIIGTLNNCTYTLPFTLVPNNIQIVLTQIGGYCEGNEVLIAAQVVGGDGNYLLDWNPQIGSGSSDFTSVQLGQSYAFDGTLIADETKYQVVGVNNDFDVNLEVVDGNGCTVTATKEVLLNSQVEMVNCFSGNPLIPYLTTKSSPTAADNELIYVEDSDVIDWELTNANIQITEISVSDNCQVKVCASEGGDVSSDFAFEWYLANQEVETQEVVSFSITDGQSLTVPMVLNYNDPYDGDLPTTFTVPDIENLNVPDYSGTPVHFTDNNYIYPYFIYAGETDVYFALNTSGLPYNIATTVTATGQSVLVHEHTGVTESANFLTGTNFYEVWVSNSSGCRKGPYAIKLTVTQALNHPAFDFVWAKPTNKDNEVEEVVDEIMKENMAEAANALLSSASACMQQQAAEMAGDFQTCFDISSFKDQFTLSYPLKEHHYTLYYYDRAGQLTKTVPPAGVSLLTDAEIVDLKDFRDPVTTPTTLIASTTMSADLTPAHQMETKYQYNGLGQLINQETPDGGITNFIYDGLNRLRFSQNAEQANSATVTYSYTKYDPLGRIVEVGESTDLSTLVFAPTTGTVIAANITLADDEVFPTIGNTQITNTVYSDPLVTVSYYGLPQRYLQNRVSYVYNDQDGDVTTLEDQNTTYYSYDAHGNVEWLIQDVAGLGQNFVKYDYDLISGNVLKVSYNEQRKDRFFHRYSYDAENRLQVVETSRNGLIWDKDANYQYYAHGPLKRTVIGEDHVQGLDYLYTIHGWLKSINTPALSSGGLTGIDGIDTDGQLTTNPGHTEVAQDRFGMSLGYYNGDYKNNKTFHNSGLGQLNGSNLYAASGSAGNDLFNGNITQWVHSQLESTNQTPINSRASTYQYDILNRIKSSQNQQQTDPTGVLWSAIDSTYKTRYEYDANGNLLLLNRFREDPVKMDKLVYLYYEKDVAGDYYDPGSGHEKTNRLFSVNDEVISSVAETQSGELVGLHKYIYDEIGNLIFEDAKEWMDLDNIGDHEEYDVTTAITWTVYGKVESVHKEIAKAGSIYQVSDIEFAYDASGNRIRKTVSRTGNSAGGLSATPTYTDIETKITYYVRDAQGNTLAVYEDEQSATNTANRELNLIEQPIYGSDRLGQNTEKVNIASVALGEPMPLPETGLKEIAEYQNWVVSANGKLNAGLNDICNTKIDLINFDLINFDADDTYSATPANEFLGIAKNGVAVAENTAGKLQFYTVLADKYLGNKDACLVYDAEGKLMKGTEYITDINTQSKPVIVQLPNANKYALVTLNSNNKPEYHIVDMGALGYGPLTTANLDDAGEILETEVALPLAAAATESYGLHFTGLEDHVNGKTIVYTTRFFELTPLGDGITEIVAYEFTSANAAPQEHVLYSLNTCADTKQGEIQLSKDGTKLLWYHHDEYVAVFDHRVADIYEIELEASKIAITGIVNVRSTSDAGNYGNGSLEGDENGDILYAQRGMYKEKKTNDLSQETEKHIWKYTPVSASSLSNITPLNPLNSYLFSEIKRGPDNKLYMPNMGELATQMQTWDASANPEEFTATEFEATDPLNPALTAGAQYQLTGSLPTQVYKMFATDVVGMSASRKVGSKQYELKDHLGNVRVVISDVKNLEQTAGVGDPLQIDAGDYFSPTVTSFSDMYPFGMGMPGRDFQSKDYRYGFNGQEKDLDLNNEGNMLDFGSRIYDSRVGRWLSRDPLANDYADLGPYNFVNNNPILLKDIGGKDWFHYMAEDDDEGDWHWHDGTTFELTTGYDLQARAATTTTLHGFAAVIVFEGSRDEVKGENDKINSTGAVTADVTVYGPGGANDIEEYVGFTMTSDPDEYTPFHEGEYTVTRRTSSGSGALPKYYQVFEDGEDNIRCVDGCGNDNVPSQVRADGEGYKTEIFIHRTNNNGWMGGHVSTGCLLIDPNDWANFHDQLDAVPTATDMKLVLTRDGNQVSGVVAPKEIIPLAVPYKYSANSTQQSAPNQAPQVNAASTIWSPGYSVIPNLPSTSGASPGASSGSSSGSGASTSSDEEGN